LAAHGITHEQALAEGIPEADALAGILALQSRASLRVAHNEQFDQRIVRIAIKRYRLEWEEDWAAAPTFCTCNTAKPILKLPPTMKMIKAGFGKQYKTPNLAETLKHFTGDEHVGAHRARADAEACARIYFAMQATESNPAATAA
jgi:DNA polymerase III epsilon subunit-like protein